MIEVVFLITAFVLALFVGYELITKVPPTLHTPLMSGTNAISGIIIIGAISIIGTNDALPIQLLAGIAVFLATVNVAGGFMVTQRMLNMFTLKKKPSPVQRGMKS